MEYKNVSVEDLGNGIVFNEKREQVKLSSLWQKNTAVLVFVRHFG